MAETKKVHAGTARQQAADARLEQQKAVVTETKPEAQKPDVAQPVKPIKPGKKVESMKNKETKVAKKAAVKVDHHKAAKKAWETMRARNAFVEGLLKKKEKAAKIVAGLVEKWGLNTAKAEALVNKVQGLNA